jgi:predicted AAA+ superfamily ATPase
MQNPFSLSFGKEPVSFIDRGKQSREIIDNFSEANPAYQVCMITGVRGAGKTVMLTDIAKYFRENEDWIVVDLSAERDLLNSFAAELSNRPDLLELFRDAKINLSFLGLGLEIDGVPPITDISVALSKMLERISKKGKRY